MMTREHEMEIFERACADWGFDFAKNSDGPNGLIYNDYNTGCMFGMFSKGFETAVQECIMLVEGFEITQEVALDEYLDYEASAVLKQHFGVE